MHANDREEVQEVYSGRHRRGRRHQADRHRRHAGRAGQADQARVDDVPRAGHQGRRRAEDEVRPGEDVGRPRPPGRGGPDVPRRRPTRRPARPRSPAWASCTSRSSSTACARVQRRGERRQAAGLLPRDHPRHGREGRGQVRQADRRLGPVRRRLHRHRAGARRGLRLRLQDQGRLGPDRVHPGGREGLSRRPCRPASRPATRWSTSA